MIIAVHYVKINGVKYMPNEIITENIDHDKKVRLLERGAIRESEAPLSDTQTDKGHKAEEPAAPAAGKNEEGDEAPEAKPDDDRHEQPGDDADEDDDYEDVEAPEIDVADSITPAEEPEPLAEKKPAHKRRGGQE